MWIAELEVGLTGLLCKLSIRSASSQMWFSNRLMWWAGSVLLGVIENCTTDIAAPILVVSITVSANMSKGRFGRGNDQSG